MKIIDAHVHTPHFPEHADADRFEGLLSEMKRNNVKKCVCMTFSRDSETPMEMDVIRQCRTKEISFAAGVNPERMTKSGMRTLEKSLSDGMITGIKIYLGYFPYYPSDKKYNIIFRIAKDNSCPVVFHTGDTLPGMVKKPKVRFSHPLNIDEVAVENPDVSFVLAHVGAPWIVDAAEVMYKNPNVYADISALIIGNGIRNQMHYENAVKMLRYAFGYVDDGKKFMYGSDWSLVGMDEYIKFAKEAVPKKWHGDVFYGNAKRIFGI